MFDPGGVEIKSAEMEVNCIAETRFVPEARATHLDHLDPAVDALSTAIIGFEHHGIDNAPEVILDCPGDLLDGFKAASHRPDQPALPGPGGPAATGVIPSLMAQARAVFRVLSRSALKPRH